MIDEHAHWNLERNLVFSESIKSTNELQILIKIHMVKLAKTLSSVERSQPAFFLKWGWLQWYIHYNHSSCKGYTKICNYNVGGGTSSTIKTSYGEGVGSCASLADRSELCLGLHPLYNELIQCCWNMLCYWNTKPDELLYLWESDCYLSSSC